MCRWRTYSCSRTALTRPITGQPHTGYRQYCRNQTTRYSSRMALYKSLVRFPVKFATNLVRKELTHRTTASLHQPSRAEETWYLAFQTAQKPIARSSPEGRELAMAHLVVRCALHSFNTLCRRD